MKNKKLIPIVITIIGLFILGVTGFIYQFYNSNTKDIKEEIKVNNPILVQGMTPIIWDDNFNEIETTENDSNWFDYANKKWANAKTEDGSYWVWIPRYVYKVTSGYHSNTTGTIDIKFLKDKTNEAIDGTKIETDGYESGVKDTSMHYFLHPAFTFGDDEVTGIWVAKYEASVADQKDLCYTEENEDNCNKNTLISAFKPNTKSWRYIDNSNIFNISFNLKNNYRWNETNVDTHLMKNTEWGAVAYLAQSKYGANEEIWINNSKAITGCAGNSVDEYGNEECQNAYNTITGVKASTTHNITGIYDMNGGLWETVSAYMNNDSINSETIGEAILNASEKYVNVYQTEITDEKSGFYNNLKNIYGDAVYETSKTGDNSTSWNNDYSLVPYINGPFFKRGGYWNYSKNSGIFSFGYSGNFPYDYNGFRATVIIQ